MKSRPRGPRRRRSSSPPRAAAAPENPCAGPEAGAPALPRTCGSGRRAKCTSQAYEGKTLLRATSDVQSRGRGPMEVRGQRDGPKSMKVNQRIYKVGGGHITVPHRRQPPLHRRRRPTSAAPTGRSTSWRASSCARSCADGKLGPVRADEPEAELLPARPRADPARQALAAHPPLPRLQPGPEHPARRRSAPRSAGRTSTPPTTTSSTSTSAACAAASSSG